MRCAFCGHKNTENSVFSLSFVCFKYRRSYVTDQLKIGPLSSVDNKSARDTCQRDLLLDAWRNFSRFRYFASILGAGNVESWWSGAHELSILRGGYGEISWEAIRVILMEFWAHFVLEQRCYSIELNKSMFAHNFFISIFNYTAAN